MRVEEPDVVDKDDPEEETETVEISTDNVGDASVELNVEELISELEAEGIGEPPESEQAAKRRFEDLMERKRHQQELEDFDDYDIGSSD